MALIGKATVFVDERDRINRRCSSLGRDGQLIREGRDGLRRLLSEEHQAQAAAVGCVERLEESGFLPQGTVLERMMSPTKVVKRSILTKNDVFHFRKIRILRFLRKYRA